MKPWMKWIGALLVVGGYVACSPKKFNADSACQDIGQNCITQGNTATYYIDETVEGGKVDILIVNDNSASMSFEQSRLAKRFRGFIENLENQKINYRIGVMTTDVSSGENQARAVNQQGALQNGNLIAFSGGQKYLSKDGASLSEKESAFNAVINRPETIACEEFILDNAGNMNTNWYAKEYYKKCPSGDERGIYALHLAVERGADGMIRPEADLAVIVLSDEDVRSGFYKESAGNHQMPLADKDKASTFTSLMDSKHPNKTYAVHSILVKDSSCLAKQNNQLNGIVSGSIGKEYARLSNMTGGIQGNICDSDYASQLQDVFDNIESKIVDKIALACENPRNLSLNLQNNSDSSITWELVGREIRFSKKLPIGAKAVGSYECDAI